MGDGQVRFESDWVLVRSGSIGSVALCAACTTHLPNRRVCILRCALGCGTHIQGSLSAVAADMRNVAGHSRLRTIWPAAGSERGVWWIVGCGVVGL